SGTPATTMTEIGVAHLQYNGGSLGFIENARGALVVLPKSGGGTGIAGVVLGDTHVGSQGGFQAGASLGLTINTTGAAMDASVTVNGTVIPIKAGTAEFAIS